MYCILQKVGKIQQALKKSEIVDVAQIKSKFSNDIIKINKKGELRLRILLPEEMSYSEFEKYQDWLKKKDVTIIFAYYPSPEIKNSRPKISCYIPLNKIIEVAKDRRTIAIRPILKPKTHVGLETTEGDTQLYAKLAREQKNVDGTGIKVGVISDGAQGYMESQANGDLGMVSILPGHEKEGMEGRAMMEVIYDLAPNCELMFGSFLYGDSTYEQMITTINDLISYGCKIIVDDIGFFDEPMFMDSELAQHITNKINNDNIIYISSAGNDAKSMYTGEINTTADDWIIFYTQNTNTYIQNMVTVDTGRTITAVLQWADDWNHPDTDLDLYLVDVNGDTVGEGGKTIQNPDSTNPPLEMCSYKNETGMPKDLYIMIKYVNGDYSARKFKLLAASDYDLQFTHENGQENEYQIYGHAAAEGAISVAAYPAQDTLHLEDFSSYGPTVLYEPTSGYSYRNTPIITATDGVKTSLYGTPFEIFYGTSASAPHIAGIAALFLDYYGYNSNSPEDFIDALTQNADGIDGGTGGVWNKHSGYGKANAYETLGGGPLKIWVDELGTNGLTLTGDSVYHWESTWKGYETPFQFEWEKGSNQLLKADTNIFNNEKFKYWKKDSSIIIQKNFKIDKNTDRIDIQFDKVYQVTLNASLTSGGTGVVQFKDPWLRDSLVNPYGKQNRGNEAIFHQYDSALVLSLNSEHQGVFLNQGWPNWDPPYYEIKAEAQQTFTAHGQDITGYFLNWEGTDVDFQHADQLETPVVFHAANAEARAVYKGHLASSVARATGYNNGRRMYKASNGTIYLVYEDNGDIWFTSSTDGGKTWNKETQLDSNTKTSFNPSLAGTLDMLFVTWFDKTDLNIKLRKFNINTSQWYNSHNVASVNFGEAIKPAPAIAVSEVVGNEYNVYIAFHREKMSDTFQPTGIHEIVCYKNSNQNFDQWNLILGPFEGRNPSLSHSQASNNGDIGLVWDHNGKIYFKGTNYYGNWTATHQISDDLWYHQDNCKPNISYTSGIAHIVWEGFHAVTEMPTGYYRYFKVDEERLSDLTVLPSHGADVHHLSVSSKKYADNTTAYDYTVVYEGDGIVKVTQTSDNFEEENFGEGKYPNITEHDMSRSVWTKYNDAPYLLKTDYVESSGGGISPIIVNPTPVIDYVISANQNNSVEGTITLEVEAVKFNHDTIYFDNALKSKTMSVTQNYVPLEMDLKVRFHNVYNGFNDEDVLYSLVFDDSTQGEIFLTNLKYKELPTPNGADFEKFFKVTTIVNLAGKTGKICLKTNGITPSLVTKRLDIFGQSTLNKSKPVTAVIPKNFALRQNFPNPFNPVTHITVELAQAAKVDLSVYTINGKKVQTLLRGHQSAGIYEVIFDGRNLASGIYIYRLTTDKGFTKAKKMMLIK